MRKFYSKIKSILFASRNSKLVSLALLAIVFSVENTNAQSWLQESFNAIGVPADTMPVDWTQGKVAGTTTYLNGNGFRRFGASSYPTIGPGGFEGTGFCRFNNRGAAYPATGAWCVASDASFLSSPPLDWTGRTALSTGYISMRFWRSNVITSGLHLVADSISVYLNDRPDLTGAVLLTETATGSTFIPRSSIMAPAGTNNAWNLLQYNLPAFGTYTRLDTSSTVYLVVKATSQGGDNMYLDSINAPYYPTTMDVRGAQLWYQETADAGKNTTNNLIVGVRFWAHGSLTPLKIDSLVFSSNGSSAPATDITNVKCWYTGSSQLFTTTTQYDITTTTANMSFGYGTGTCASWAISTPATFQCKPGWNYYWLTYDIPATAVAGHYVDADFVGYNYGTQGCVGFRAVNLSVSGGRQIDQAYPIPTYTAGTSWAGYTHNDYVSAVETINGLNGTYIDNWYHDTWVGAPCPTDCDRFSPHPPDYTQFSNQAVVISHKQRGPVQVNEGQGVRQGTAALIIHAAPGTWYSSDCIAVFVDWNKDGDFYDTYGSGPAISENYGTQCLSAGIISNPFGIGNPFGTWSVDVPGKNDAVTNVAGTGANMAGGQLFLGNVRLRVREVYAAGVIHPTQSGYTWGEVEDYTMNVLDNCPTPATFVCKWIGNTTSWSDPNNWCPTIPDINRMAYIPVVNSPFVYPVVDSGTIANCRTLKIVDGAHVTIDCQATYASNGTVASGSMTVTDSIIIGAGLTNSTAYLRVNSSSISTTTIPGATVPIPGGFGSLLYTPFKANSNSKFQISYKASDLYNLYGLRGGDVVDQLVCSLKTTPASAANYPINSGVTWGGFRIRAYFTNSFITWPGSLNAGVSVAVRQGLPSVNWNDTIYSSYPGNVQATINSGQAAVVFNLIPNKLIWDGVSNLVLSFEYYGPIVPAVTASQMYCEASFDTACFYATCNTAATAYSQTASGYSIDGSNASNGASSGATVVSAATTVYRPRIDFVTHKRYARFPITVGKAFVNNNNSGAPVGANGFIAGNSKVKFDPSVRAAVSSLGLASQINQWNPTGQSQFLAADTMVISSGINPVASHAFTQGTSSTVFNEIELVGTAGAPVAGSILKQFKNTYADTLTLTSGELNLNKNTFTLKNPASNTLTYPAGWIKSEDQSGLFSSLFTWKIGTSTGAHTIPFGKSNTDVFPFIYNGSAGDVGDLTVGSYYTYLGANNTPLPIAPTLVYGMLTNASVDATPWTVDRFWYIKRSTASAITSTVSFQYNNTNEGTASAGYTSTFMKAQRYGKNGGGVWGWNNPTTSPALFVGQADSKPGTVVTVNVPAAGAYIDNVDQFVWTVVNFNSGAPLPIELLSFDAKQINDKVKVWWDVQNEKDVVDYTVERTVDQNTYDFIASVSPIGPSSGILNYNSYDENPLVGLQYYRLKTSSIDGSIKYSQLVPVKFNGKGVFAITIVQTNNDAGSITVDFVYDSSLPYNYLLTDMMGSIVASGTNNGFEGSNRIEIPATIAQGIYMISIRNTEKTVSAKLKF